MHTEQVFLKNPLPASMAGQTWGTVIALSPTHVVVRLQDHSIIPQSHQIQFTVRFGQTELTVSGNSLVLTPGQLLVEVVDDAARRQVQDLLNLVRKDQHIDICQQQDVESSDRYTGFQEFNFIPAALPEVNYDETITDVNFLGQNFSYPLLITGMTGGLEKGAEINRRLAQVASQLNIPMGIGSQRLALENPAFAPIFAVKKYTPNLFLIGNMGFAQLRSPKGIEDCQRAVDMIEANALAIHVNVLQECVQVEGDRHFAGVMQQIEKLCHTLSVPVMVKEVGCGFDTATAKRLYECGVSTLDVGGRGGTSWGFIEGLRTTHAETVALSQVFRNWGIPTAFSLRAVAQELPEWPLIATGGIRDGLTVAKAVAMGARFAGIGLPLLRAALISEQEAHHVLMTLVRGLKMTLVLTGSRTLADLREKLVLGIPYAPSTSLLR